MLIVISIAALLLLTAALPFVLIHNQPKKQHANEAILSVLPEFRVDYSDLPHRIHDTPAWTQGVDRNHLRLFDDQVFRKLRAFHRIRRRVDPALRKV